MSEDAKTKADEANGKEENPDEVLTTGDPTQVQDVGVDTSSVTPQDIESGTALRAQEAKSGAETFMPASVIAVINDPLDAFELFDKNAKIKKKIKNYVDLKKAPRGSLLVKPMDEKVEQTFDVVFPFFQSHVMLPVSIGETVWTISLAGRKYWFSRVAGSSISEDVNHTHVDRDLTTPTENKDSAKEKDEKAKGKKKNFIGRFFSGLGIGAKKENVSQEDAKPQAVLEKPVYKPAQHEPIPRYSPKMGDLVLQGSHNTLISFSTDRGWTKLDEEFTKSNSNDQFEQGRGTIDIVVGRGQLAKDVDPVEPTTEDAKGTEPPRTSMSLIQNDLGAVETDKHPTINDIPANQAEGDPDFYTDLSRIYVSMNSPIDEKLTLSEQSPVLAGDVPLEDQEGPAVAIKSNQIRIVAREDGSIRIVKEGNPEEEETTRASIVLQPDGSIHVVGEKIFLGKSKDEGGHEGVDPEGTFEAGKMNPYIRFSVVQKYLEDVHKSFDSFCQTLLSHTTPGYGSPSPQINSAANKLKSDMKKHEKLIEQFASERIFGE